MSLAPGSRLGPYEILGPLGAGGMGEVWRAQDPRLGRQVAIKVLPEALARDPERLARFEREARLLASLQHPDIAVLHGLEEAEGRRFIVMERIEGESLAERLRRGPLPLAEVLEAGRHVAAALEAAHESGVVHRDLKPGNVMLTPSGHVKVLDFGLARGGESASTSSTDLSASPTLTYAGTQAGVVLGTAAYMSPEQARGKAVDRRTDIWSFGCLLFECLTSRQAFAGETVSDVVARILQGEPEWNLLPARTPERLRDLMRRCLEKDARRRLRDIGDARLELEHLIARQQLEGSGVAAAATDVPWRPPPWVGAVALAAVAAVLTGLVMRTLGPPRASEPARFEVEAPRDREVDRDAMGCAISPDGRTVAFATLDSSGTRRISVRGLEALAARELPGTERVTSMFWSPDSRWLGFFTENGRLQKVRPAGGEPEVLCDARNGRGGTWSRHDVILFAPYSSGGLYRVSANGGDPVQVTRPDSAHGEFAHRFPQFLPDGRHFLYCSLPERGNGSIHVGSLERGPGPRVLEAEWALYAAPGYLLFDRRGVLVAQPFDAARRRPRGEPIPVGDALGHSDYLGSPIVSASQSGALAFVTASFQPTLLAWLGLADGRLTPVSIPSGPYTDFRVSPDGRRAMVTEAGNAPGSLWMADLERGVLTRFTTESETASLPRWSPDGRRVAYLEESIVPQLAVRSLADGSTRTRVASDPAFKRLYSWTTDGRSLVFGRLDPATRWDLWTVGVDADTIARPLARTPASETDGEISPDGRWLLYRSDESGRAEAYVQPSSGAGPRYQVTTDGVVAAHWIEGGRRLAFVVSKDPRRVFAADVRAGREFTLGPAREWLRLPEVALGADVPRDGRRVLCLLPAAKERPETVTLVLDWPAALRRP